MCTNIERNRRKHTPVLRVPVAAEHGSRVCREHSLVAVGSPDVPQLHVSVLEGGGEGEIILHTELHISDALRLT